MQPTLLMQRHSLSWVVPALEATVVRVRDADQAARLLEPSGIRLRALGDGLFVAWARAPLEADALKCARVVRLCAPVSKPSAALLELLARDYADECLIGLGLYRVGSDTYLRQEQLCATTANAAGGNADRMHQRLQPTVVVRGTIVVAAKARGHTAVATFEPTVIRLRPQRPWCPAVLGTLLPSLRRELDAKGVVDMRNSFHDYEARHERAVALLVPSLARVTVLALATDRHTLEASVVSKLQLVRTEEVADSNGAEDEDGGGEYVLKPDWDLRVAVSERSASEQPPSARIPFEEIPLWALVQVIESSAGGGGGDGEDDYEGYIATHDVNSLSTPLHADPSELSAALLEIAPSEHEKIAHPSASALTRLTSAQRVLVVNAVHLFDAVGLVPSIMDPAELIQKEQLASRQGEAAGRRQAWRECVSAFDACAALCAALGGDKHQRASGSAADSAAPQLGDSRPTMLRAADSLVQRAGSFASFAAAKPVMASAAVSRSPSADGGARDMEVDNNDASTIAAATAAGAAREEGYYDEDCDEPPLCSDAQTSVEGAGLEKESEQLAPPRVSMFCTAAQLQTAKESGKDGTFCSPRAELTLKNVLQRDKKLSVAGLRAIDAAFEVCDRDRDGFLNRSDLDYFQATTGGDALDDDDLAYFCSTFESVASAKYDGGRALTRIGFRAYFAHAFAEDATIALADLKAFSKK